MKKQKWMPEHGDMVWFFYEVDSIIAGTYNGHAKLPIDCFRTRSLARAALKKIKKVLKDCRHG